MVESQTFSNATPRAGKKYKVSKPILLSTKEYKKQQKIKDQEKREKQKKNKEGGKEKPKQAAHRPFVKIPEENFRFSSTSLLSSFGLTSFSICAS